MYNCLGKRAHYNVALFMLCFFTFCSFISVNSNSALFKCKYVETYIGDIQHGHYDLHDTYCSIDVNKKLISIWGVSTNGHDIMAEYTIIKVEDTKRDGQYTTIVFLARTHMNGNIVRIILDSYYRKLSIITDSSTVVFGIGKP